jgi:two-component system response regulator
MENHENKNGNNSSKILIICDKSKDWELVTRVLRTEFRNSEIIEVRSKSELEIIDDFSAVIIDMQLSWGDGIEIAGEIRKKDKTKPIIALAHPKIEEVVLSEVGRGIDCYVMKSPLHYKKLPYFLKSAINWKAKEVEFNKLRETLEEREEMYKCVVENAKDGILIIQNGLVKFLNRKLAEMWGGEVEEVLNTPFTNYIHPDDVNRVLEIHKKRLSKKDAESIYEARLLRKNGRTAYAEISATLIKYKGETAVLAVIRDITDRKTLYNELKRREKWFRALVENSADVILVLSESGEVKYVSPSVERVAGYKPEEVEGEMVFKFAYEEDYQYIYENLLFLLETPGNMKTIKFRAIHKNGEIRYVEATGWNQLDNPIVNGIIVNFRDITDRVEAEKRLKESERRYRELWENANDILYIHDPNGVLLDGNKMAREKFGYTKDDAGKVNLADIIDKEYISKAMQTIDRILKGEDINEVQKYLCRTKDGKELWLEVRSQPIIENGRIVAIQGIARDITEREILENKLRKSEMEKSLILNSINELIIYHGRDKRITWANKTAGDSVNMKPEELTDRYCYEIWHNRKEPCVDCPVYACWESGDYEEGETITPDGRVWFIKAYPVYEGGELTGVVEICEDITEKRKFEKERRLAYEQIERNIENYAILVDEIRNPLNVLLGMIELNFTGESAEVMMEQIEKIQRLLEKLDQGWLESENVRKFLKKYI